MRALGIPGEHIPPDAQDRARLYASVLTDYAQAGRPILVVVDNASDAEQARPLLPSDQGCRAIVTSRHTLGMLGARLLDLGVLPPAEAVQLLDRALRVARPGDTRITDHPADAAAGLDTGEGYEVVRRDTRSREHGVTTGDDISDIAHEIVSWLKGRSRPRPTS